VKRLLHGSLEKSDSGDAQAGAAEVELAQGAGWTARRQRPRRGPWLQWWSIEGWEFNRVELRLANLPSALAGLRLLHISDLHLRSKWPIGLDALVEAVKGNPPDVILYGGDQAHNMHHLEPSLPHIERLVKELPSRFGAFAVLGNHDGDLMGPKLTQWGVRVISHDRVDVAIHGETLELIGFPGPARRDFDEAWVARLPAKRDRVVRIILSHYPDLILHAVDLKPDLYLAGHTHGGQICFPGEIPILRHDSLPRRFCHGMHAIRDLCLSVSRGMGFSSAFQVRVFAPCEVVEVTLRPLQT
jgi:predicted MPP superfamily phosphohydrolase